MWCSLCISGVIFEVTDRFKALECAKDYKDRIVKIHKREKVS